MTTKSESAPEKVNLVEVVEQKKMIAPIMTENKVEQEIVVPSESKPVKCFNRFIIKSSPLMNNKLFNKIVLFVLLSFTVWLLSFIIFDAKALPGGVYFSLLTLLVCGHVFGYFFEKIKLPSLLGKCLINRSFV